MSRPVQFPPPTRYPCAMGTLLTSPLGGQLNEAKEAFKKMKADRDQARAELRVNKRGLRQHLEKLKSEMEVKHDVHIKEKERTHRQELQKHVRKVIWLKLETLVKVVISSKGTV